MKRGQRHPAFRSAGLSPGCDLVRWPARPVRYGDFLSQVAFDLLVAPLNAALADKMPGQVIFTSPSRYFAMKIGLGAFVTACVVLPLVLTKAGRFFLARKGIEEDETSWFRMRYTPLLFVAGLLVVYLAGLPLWCEMVATMMPPQSDPPTDAISAFIREDLWGGFMIDYVNGAMQTILIVGLGAQAAGMYLVYRKSRPEAHAGLSVT